MPGELGFFIKFNTPCPSRCKTFPSSPDAITAGAGGLLRITECQDPRSSCPPISHNLNLSPEQGRDLPKVTQSVCYITQDRKRSGLCFGHPRLSFTQLTAIDKGGCLRRNIVPKIRLLSLQERPKKAASEPLLYSPHWASGERQVEPDPHAPSSTPTEGGCWIPGRELGQAARKAVARNHSLPGEWGESLLNAWHPWGWKAREVKSWSEMTS